MLAGGKGRCLGSGLLVLSLVAFILVLVSTRWTLGVHGAGDRWRLTLGSDVFGAGMLSYEAIRDPTARFMIPFRRVERLPVPWDLRWRLPSMRAHPVMIDPKGLGSYEIPGVAWLNDSKTVRAAALLFWPVPLLLAIPGALLWWRGRRALVRARQNRCLRCGYDRRGLESESACPECGSAGLAPGVSEGAGGV